LYDENGKYLDRITSTKLDCPDIHYQHILRNLPECNAIFLMSLKQRIIMNESGVRFNARKDIAGMQAKIAEIDVPTDSKMYLRDVSARAYQILKLYNFFDYLVEFDAERSANVRIFGKRAKVVGSFDMLAIMDDKPLVIPKPQEIKQKPRIKREMKNNKADDASNFNNNDDVDDISSTDTISEDIISSKSLGKAALTVIVTARNNVSTLDIFKQFLYMYIQNLSRFFLLVVHVGPLVEKEEIVLYEYKPPRSLLKIIKSFRNAREKSQKEEISKPQTETDKLDRESCNYIENIEFVVSQTVQKSNVLGPQQKLEEATKTNDLDLSQLEAEFRKVKGHHLQKVAPLRDYFRYMVYDCPGVKDHQKDNRDRFERYTFKRERKREEKIKQAKELAKENDCENEPVFTFESNN
jgi:hypothetical protein